MRDVFKYFKRRSPSNKMSEEDFGGIELLKKNQIELGYEYRSRGVWLDPRTGKRLL